MGIGKRIKEARESKGLTQNELGELVGVTGSAITNYEKETSHPKEPVMYKLLEALKVDANYLFQDVVNIPVSQNSFTPAEIEHIKKYRTLDPFGQETVNYILNREAARSAEILQKDARITALENSPTTRLWAYYGKIACAGAGFIFDDIPTALIEAPPADADFIIGVSGDSMEPDYHDGEKLYVKKAERIRHGEIGIFTIRNECFLKEYGEAGLISKNPRYADIPGDEDVRLVGKVVGKVEE